MDTQRSARTEFLSHSLKSQNQFSSFLYRLYFLGYFTIMNRRLSDYALTLLRMYMGGNAVVTWHNAISEPQSLIALSTRTSDGLMLVWLLGIVGALMAIDVIINDVMPKRYIWSKALKNRHFLFSALAFCYVSQLFVGVMAHQGVALLIYYIWNASIIMVASFLDAKKRSRDAGCAMLYS
jgi:hypothetical protein